MDMLDTILQMAYWDIAGEDAEFKDDPRGFTDSYKKSIKEHFDSLTQAKDERIRELEGALENNNALLTSLTYTRRDAVYVHQLVEDNEKALRNAKQVIKCPECGVDAKRPRCLHELNPDYCPRHEALRKVESVDSNSQQKLGNAKQEE